MIDPHRLAFKEEAYELLADLEGSLLELEKVPDDAELIGRVFRSMHTIKGSGAMFGFDDIASFTHEVETVFDRVRGGQVPVTPELINLTLQARDKIKSMLDETPKGEADSGPTADEIVFAFKRFAQEEKGKTLPTITPSFSSVEEASPSPLKKIAGNDSATYRIRFKPAQDIFTTGTNPILLLKELHQMGDCQVTALTDTLPALDEIDPEACYTSWDILLTTDQGLDAIRDVFIFVEDQSELKIDVIDRPRQNTALSEPEEENRKIGEILVERGDVTKEALDKTLAEKKYIGEMLVEKGLITSGKVESALIEQEHLKKVREKSRPKDETASSIRVPAERLDVLVNLVGELVTVQARLTQTASTAASSELTSIAEEVERLTGELRDNTLNIRMLPIGATFGKFKRLVRDLSRELGKEIEMTTEGEETELDKTVIEKLNDPLVHLIRNSIDHGIESPEMRESTGKPRTGTIHLSAVHSGGNVVIRIKDDGMGLDREAIFQKAVEKGLVSANAVLTDKEINNIILSPGFSTATKVTSVSGRGVGMDVVKKAIDSLRGTIDIESEKGKGSTVTVKLPLTLAIIEGLLVNIGENCFVLPLSIVEECVELTREDSMRSHGRNMASIRGELVPYIRLRHEFAVPGEPPPIEQIVITGNNGERIGFVVDSVVGEHQTVIKNLGRAYKDVDTISGATILGDGTVALIVDVQKVVNGVEHESCP